MEVSTKAGEVQYGVEWRSRDCRMGANKPLPHFVFFENRLKHRNEQCP